MREGTEANNEENIARHDATKKSIKRIFVEYPSLANKEKGDDGLDAVKPSIIAWTGPRTSPLVMPEERRTSLALDQVQHRTKGKVDPKQNSAKATKSELNNLSATLVAGNVGTITDPWW